MKFSSIFYSITFIFTLSSGIIFLAFLWLMDYDQENYTRDTKYSIVSRATLMHLNGLLSDNEYAEQIKDFAMPEVTEGRDEILAKATMLDTVQRDIGTGSILEYKRLHYLRLDFGDQTYLLVDDTYQPYRYVIIKAIFWLVFGILVATYVFVIRKIKPLRKLKRQIDRFAAGDLDVKNVSTGSDEISEVAEAFYNAVTQIKLLNSSRQLFLRNIMHELKTPITKGRITAEMIEKGKYQERLIGVFERLESLINEFATVERAASGFANLNTTLCLVRDIIDEALDIAMAESSSVSVDLRGEASVQADFKLLAIAFKNMIDNGLKYSSDRHVAIVAGFDAVRFITNGSPLENDLDYYTQPFTQGSNAKKSFGLGLYIVANIVKAHKFKFEYEYANGQNIFKIIF